MDPFQRLQNHVGNIYFIHIGQLTVAAAHLKQALERSNKMIDVKIINGSQQTIKNLSMRCEWLNISERLKAPNPK